MKLTELLDEIISSFTSLPQDAKLSETIKAHQEAMKILEKALLTEYERGCIDTSERMHKMQIKKQIRNN